MTLIGGEICTLKDKSAIRVGSALAAQDLYFYLCLDFLYVLDPACLQNELLRLIAKSFRETAPVGGESIACRYIIVFPP